MKFWSHTLVKNGQPFIDLVIRQVLPFTEKSLITVSKKSDDGTLGKLHTLQHEFPTKVVLNFENVSKPNELTGERQKQLDATPMDTWVLFLDDDDFWPTESLELITERLNGRVDAYAVKPIQIINQTYHDLSWEQKWFTKWFRKQPGLEYRDPWPKDLLYLNGEMLYWKKNTKVKKIDGIPYFHLSNIKYHSFRTESWAKKYHKEPGQKFFIPELYSRDIERIYECFK